MGLPPPETKDSEQGQRWEEKKEGHGRVRVSDGECGPGLEAEWWSPPQSGQEWTGVELRVKGEVPRG